MADEGSIKLRAKLAQQRIQAACPRIAKLLGVAPPIPIEQIHNPNFHLKLIFDSMLQSESTANFLESIIVELKPVESPERNTRTQTTALAR